MRHIVVNVDTTGASAVLAPFGITTPYDTVTDLHVEGGRVTQTLHDADLDLSAALIESDGESVTLTYDVTDAASSAIYPDRAFAPRQNRFTVAADDLAEASAQIAQSAGGGLAGIKALVAEAESRFSYAHPKTRFNDGTDAVPYLSCGLTPGSCIDINTYLVASLRAAGYEAAYLYGYFFPEERGGTTVDGHCWVATRHEGETLEWDIAHHIKADLGKTKPGLNPRPGRRVAVSHSMGHRYGDATGALMKILGEPQNLDTAMRPVETPIKIRMRPWT